MRLPIMATWRCVLTNREIYRFQIGQQSVFSDVQESLYVAIFAAEGLHGRAQVQLALTHPAVGLAHLGCPRDERRRIRSAARGGRRPRVKNPNSFSDWSKTG